MDFIPDWLLHTMYGLPAPAGKRQKPMQVLAVGISRSGTESLREALHILGFDHTYHGFDTILPPCSLEATYRLLQKKYCTAPSPGPQSPKLTAEDFDTILGDSVGVSDLLAAEFAPELIAAYPDAKVILNLRRDLDGWYRSMQQTMGYFDSNPMDWDWCKSWFSAELFWVRQAMCRTMMPRFFRGSFHSNGKWVYDQHVASIKGFLDKEVPQMDFPNGNPPKAWAERIAMTMEMHHRRAVWNMLVFGGVMVVWLALLVSYFW
ncbi:hypothetical protein N7474_001933 [Penicillium riverlandense]|uniref:uncharacterized protein n=1 Tax=Penicillium riverlandense TaxID=1903569 RepID=UPI002546E1AB|nr:uncharacterized protein N7474_001933 [Penicillium riverlandense]KAJ5833622.1 hypothetical protein N7474_001933 [Penicillium riverlandense]